MVHPAPRVGFVLSVVIVATAALTSCDLFGPSGPGAFRVTLVSPHGLEGAAVLELSGGVGLGAVTSESGDVHVEHAVSTTHVIVILDEPDQIAFMVETEDVGTRPRVVVLQVADGDNRLRAELSEYRVELEQLEAMGMNVQARSP